MNYAMHFQLIKQQDLEASLAASMSREKETMEQTAALEKEKENLARELASYINKEKDKVHELYIVRSLSYFWKASVFNPFYWGCQRCQLFWMLVA